MNLKNIFVPITKVDVAQRLVYGTVAEEVVDKADEIFDYASCKPLFEKWSGEIAKATDGKSVGNVRAMHGKVAAGKLTTLSFDDSAKRIEACAKIVDDAEWKKVEEGVYTGFSMGGKYVARWADATNVGKTRYTAEPSEVSIVDNPCIPTATFSLVKMDGQVEQRHFKQPEADPAAQAQAPAVTNEAVAAKARELAKAAGDEAKWSDHIAAARTELEKAAAEAAKAASAAKPEGQADDGAAGVEQVWKAKDGKTFTKKAEAIAHNKTLEPPPASAPLTDALKSLTAAVEKAEGKTPETLKTLLELAKKVGAFKGLADDAALDLLAKNTTVKLPAVEANDKGEVTNAAALVAAFDEIAKATPKPADDKAKAADPKTIVAADAPNGSFIRKLLAVTNAAPRADTLRKGLYDVARLANLLQDLAWLRDNLISEALWERDKSPLPQALSDALKPLCEVLARLVVEETSELFANDEDVTILVELAAGLVDGNGAAIAKTAGDAIKADAKLGERLAKAIPALEKAGARHSKDDKARVQKMHDTAVELGADCGTGEKAAPADDLTKIQADNADLRKGMTEAVEVVKSLQGRVELLAKELTALKSQPIPGGPVQLHVVGKGGADDSAVAAEVLKNLTPDQISAALIKASLNAGGTRVFERGKPHT